MHQGLPTYSTLLLIFREKGKGIKFAAGCAFYSVTEDLRSFKTPYGE